MTEKGEGSRRLCNFGEDVVNCCYPSFKTSGGLWLGAALHRCLCKMFDEGKEREKKKKKPCRCSRVLSAMRPQPQSLTSRKQQPLLHQVPVWKNKVDEFKGKTNLYKSSDVVRPAHLYQHLRSYQKITRISFFILWNYSWTRRIINY